MVRFFVLVAGAMLGVTLVPKQVAAAMLYQTDPITQAFADGWIDNTDGQTWEQFSLTQAATISSVDFVVRAGGAFPNVPSDVDVAIYGVSPTPGVLGSLLFSQD